MNKRSGRGRIRIKLEDIALFNYSKNPRVISYLPPLGDEEGEPGSKGGTTPGPDCRNRTWAFESQTWGCRCSSEHRGRSYGLLAGD